MNLFSSEAKIVITCNKRLAPYLQQEIISLGGKNLQVFPTRLELMGTLNDCIRYNLCLRCASQVLYELASFPASDAQELYENVKQIHWEEIIPAEAHFSITSNVFNDTINNNMFANLRVKDAIVDRIRTKTGKRPNSGATLDATVIHLHWQEEIAKIFIDTSGQSIARHGYRKFPGRAPMLEALAAATVLASAWNGRSNFINPMCGSGTLAIEAALIATDTKPGLFRSNFGFMHILGYEEQVFLDERNKQEAAIKDQGLNIKIIATDFSAVALEAAKKNAKAAGVAHLIDFSLCDFKETPIPKSEPSVVMLNPEYGLRLGELDALTRTYEDIGNFLKKKCEGYRGYVFTGNLDLAKHIGLKAKRRIEFYNGKLDCRLLEYELYSGSRRPNN